jgi:hypothetical protein
MEQGQIQVTPGLRARLAETINSLKPRREITA